MTYPPAVVARGLHLYLKMEKPTLREAHRLLCEELRQKGAKTVPTWRLFGTWAKRGDWNGIKNSLLVKVQQATGESLAEWRIRRARQLDQVIDAAFSQDANGDARFLSGKAPGAVLAKFLEVGDRLRGGGEKHEVVLREDPVADLALRDPEAAKALAGVLAKVKASEEPSEASEGEA